MNKFIFFTLLLPFVVSGVVKPDVCNEDSDCQGEMPMACFNKECTVKTQLVVMGGITSEGINGQVEVVDLSGKMRTCQKDIANFDYLYGMSGFYHQGRAVVCGGIGKLFAGNKCLAWDKESNSWKKLITLGSQRANAAGVEYDKDNIWITGGPDQTARLETSTATELCNLQTGKCEPHVDLPEPKSRHNLVKIDDDKIMLVGNEMATKKAWLFSKLTLKWTRLPDSLVERETIFAGLVTFPDGKKGLVVAGGQKKNSSEIFSFENNAWTEGPNLPVNYELYGGSSVPYGNTFLTVGGYDSKHESNTGKEEKIFMFNTKENRFEPLAEKLSNPRHLNIAFLVPEGFFECL